MLAGWMTKTSAMFSTLRRDLRGVTPMEYGIVLVTAAIIVGATMIGILGTDLAAPFAYLRLAASDAF